MISMEMEMIKSATTRTLLLLWLITSQLFHLAALAIFVIMWGFSGEIASLYFFLLIGYLISVIAGSWKSWTAYASGKHRTSFSWTLLPYGWFMMILIYFLT